MMIKVIKTGIYSSIQDQGRFGYRNIGVPVSGVMDATSANLANALLDNNINCAVLETTLIGPTLKFNIDTYIAISGADCCIKLNKNIICLNTVIPIKEGDVLIIGKTTAGIRSYLAVTGGFQTEKILGSRSFYSGITKNGSLEKGELLSVCHPSKDIINRTSIATNNQHINQNTLSAFKGPEFDLLDPQTQTNLRNSKFEISTQSNRMAYKLIGNLPLKANDIITSSVQPGTIQLTPSGELIVSMRDCQTTGGYARVLQLSNQAINQLSQNQSTNIISLSIRI